MPRSPKAPPTHQQAHLTIDQKRSAILRLQRRIAELKAFDPARINDRQDASITSLEQAIDRTLTDVFGHDSVEYIRYGDAKRIDKAGLVMGYQIPIDEVREGLRRGVAEATAILQGIINGFEEDIQDSESAGAPTPANEVPKQRAPNRKIFVVHGHEQGARDTVVLFLERLDLKPIVLSEQLNAGLTVIEKLERHTDVDFAVVILTGDDEGRAKSGAELRDRARQNVMLELGYFLGALGRPRVCALKRGSIEVPSDYEGVVFVDMDAPGAWKSRLAMEIQGAGTPIDGEKLRKA